MPRRAVLVPLLALAALVGACGGDGDADGDTGPGVAPGLVVFAASSLRDVVPRLGEAYAAANGGTRFTYQFAGSDELATQLGEGARADVLLAASPRYPEELARQGLVGAGVPFATNALVIAVPAGSSATGPETLAAPGTKVVLAAPGVPAGDLAAAVLDQLDGLYGDGFAARVRDNVVSEEQNVRGVVAKVASGDADAGLVYATDVPGGDLVAIPVPAGVDATTVLTGATIVSSRVAGEAARFLAFVSSAEGRAILADAGFGPAP